MAPQAQSDGTIRRGYKIVELKDKADLRAAILGQFIVFVRIFYDRADKALVLPRTCLFRGDAGHWQVMIVQGGRTALASVGVGLMNDEQIQITSGLDHDATVVALPSREIEAGIRVTTTQR